MTGPGRVALSICLLSGVVAAAPTPASARSILVIAPHPDDEALATAGRIRAGILAGDTVNVVLVTNGDINGTEFGLARIAESVAAVQVLGLTEDHVVFMGYGDAALSNLWEATDGTHVYTSLAGHTETYANRGLGLTDFHSYRTGVPGPYNRDTILADFKALITLFNPDDIYTLSYWDYHADHSSMARFVTQAVIELKKAGTDVRARVFESIVWPPNPCGPTGGWPGGPIGSLPGPPFTAPPCVVSDTSLDWASIQKFPVPPAMQLPDPATNLKWQTILAYPTADIQEYLFEFVRKDEFFWLYDFGTNLSAVATVTASSEASGGAKGQAIDGFADSTHEWRSDQSAGEWIQLDWTSPVRVAQVNLYDPLDLGANVLSGALSFSDGSSIPVGALPTGGKPLPVTFAPRTVSWVRFTVDQREPSGEPAGLAEIDVLGKPASQTANIAPHFIYGPSPSPAAIDASQTSTVTLTAYDLDGDTLQYAWSADGGSIVGAGDSAVFTPPLVTQDTTFTITVQVTDGQGGTTSGSTFVTVSPRALPSSLSLSPSSAIGGNTVQATVTLAVAAPSGGTVLQVAAGDSPFVTVPATVTVAEGNSTAVFSITTLPVESTQTITITATAGGRTASAALTLDPVLLTGLSISPGVVHGGVATQGTVTLNGSAGADVVVQLSTSDAPVAAVPATVVVPAGASAASFAITTSVVPATTSVTISATLGSVSLTAPLTVQHIETLSTFALFPPTVLAGADSTGTVTLSGPAPVGGVVVALSSSDPAVASVPTTVAMAEGASMATFTVATHPVAETTSVTVSAALADITLTHSLSVSPSAGAGRSILVIAPHPFDEALTAAGRILAARQAGDTVNVVIVTNGDASGGTTQGLARQAETVAAAQVLGLPEQNVIFMGYGEQALSTLWSSTSGATVYTSPAGQTQTYGNRGLGGVDFHRDRTGVPGPYNRDTILEDFKALITGFRPDEIYTLSYWDWHFDRSSAARFVTEALIASMREGADIPPVRVFESMILPPNGCSTENWPGAIGSQLPGAPFTEPPCVASQTTLDWASIQKFPVPAGMQLPDPAANLKRLMIDAYTSADGKPFLWQFARKDEFFWPYDYGRNVSVVAQVSVSGERVDIGGAKEHAIDGFADADHEWRTNGVAGQWIQLDWPSPVRIAQVNLYDRLDIYANVVSGTLTFSDGSSVPVGALPTGGKPLPVTFAPRTVSWVRFTVDQGDGQVGGLAEIDVLGVPASETANIAPHFIYGPSPSPAAIAVSQTSTVTLTAHDLDGNALQYAWSADGGSIVGTGASAVFTPPLVTQDTIFTITVQVTDGQGGTTSGSTFVAVTPTFTLTIDPVPVNGTVSGPGGLSCGTGGAVCSAAFNAGTAVVLVAVPDTGYGLMGWTGAVCTGPTCAVTMDAPKTVSATFIQQYTLTIDPLPVNGTVSGPGGILCGVGGAVCSAAFNSGTLVDLVATGETGYALLAWTGAVCSGPTCSVTMDAHKTVGGTFVQQYTLTIDPVPVNGTVTGDGGINCGTGGAVCSAVFNTGTLVNLVAVPDTGYGLMGWTGACSGPTCSVTMDAAKAVSATFVQQYTLTIDPLPVNGTVTGPGGLSCGTGGAVCAAAFNAGTAVDLVAVPDTGYGLMGWTGAVCTGLTCSVTMDAHKTVGGTFIQQYTLTIDPLPVNGTVTGDGGINCGTGGAVCSAVFNTGTLVNLVATPETGYALVGWTGACSGPTCAVTMDAAKTVGATFIQQYTLTIDPLPVNGTVSGPGGILCGVGGAVCSAAFNSGTLVDLVATPETGYALVGWTGACSGPTCAVTMDAAKTVGATFIQQYTLTIDPLPVNGTVTGDGGINCGTGGAVCSAVFNTGTVVNLAATADTGYGLVGWTGTVCTGPTCAVTMDAAKTVGATFIQQYTLTIDPLPVNGTVSGPGGILCGVGGAVCSAAFNSGTLVNLVATPETGYALLAWTGACSGPTCAVTMDAAKTVGATFIQQYTLTIDPLPVNGTVSGPGGLSCGSGGAVCTAAFNSGTLVNLVATPETGYALVGWTGACSGPTCSVTMDAAKTVGATFIQQYTLTIDPLPVNGTVSGPGGILCGVGGAVCSAAFNSGTLVDLVATPETGYALVGWTGACSGPTCAVTMDAAKTVGATFIQQYTLTIDPLPVNGTVSGPGGILCGVGGAVCSAAFNSGTLVNLVATGETGYALLAWTGAVCTGPTCAVTMDAPKTVGTTFIQQYTLTIDPLPVNGTVTGDGGINCGTGGAVCSAVFNTGTLVNLVATADTGYGLVGWTGAVCTGPTCAVTMDAAKTVGATFIQQYTLTIDPLPVNGTVSGPGGILCGVGGAVCSAAFNSGTLVNLVATPDTGYALVGWTGACTGPTCAVTMDAAKTVGATFIQQYTLTIDPLPVNGTVSGPGGILCGVGGAVCSAAFNSGTLVNLVAAPDTGHALVGWTGACSGLTCAVTMDAPKTVGATFIQQYTLTIDPVPVNGTVSGPGGILCGVGGAVCSAAFNSGTLVDLVATGETGYALLAWTGAVCTGPTCSVTMDAAKTVSATFIQQYTLTIDPLPVNGTVTGDGGINCGTGGAVCSAVFNTGTVVNLAATADTGYGLVGWTGAVCTGPTCAVTMDAAKTVGATFIQQYTLTIDPLPVNGTVSGPGGLSCGSGGAVCTAAFNSGTLVNLVATPETGYALVGWTGACSGPTCAVTMDAAKTVGATFIQQYTLTIDPLPVNGTVSGPGGILCGVGGAVCSAAFNSGTLVDLVATPDTGYALVGWTGACSGPTCSVTMDAAKTVGATFIQQYTLTIDPLPVNGTVSGPGGLSCGTGGAVCTALFNVGTVVNLAATADTGYGLVGWTGACSGLTCAVTMDAAKTVGATFIQQYTLTIDPLPVNGTVTGPGGLSCGTGGAVCAAAFNAGTAVDLVATPETGYALVGWTGACTGPTCAVTMDAPKTVGATFIQQYTLTIDPLPVNGTVTGPGGILCGVGGAVCSAAFNAGTLVDLVATPETGYALVGWTGACSGLTCAVTMDAAKAVSATFIQQYTLTIDPLPEHGTVSGPGGLSCGSGGAVCTAAFNVGTLVDLVATPETGYALVGWTGACTGLTCAVTMDAPKTVGVTFIQQYTLTIDPLPVNGTASGPGGILCGVGGAVCSAAFNAGTLVNLVAAPDTGHALVGWTGACSGLTCAVTMDAPKTVGATFIQQYTLTIDPLPVKGTVNGPGGLSCGSGGAVCTAAFNAGTLVNLVATPETGYALVGWTGACTGPTCAVTMDAAKTVGATFTIQRFTLTVTPPVNGTITGTGISCDSLATDCSDTYDYGTVVALTATPVTGYELSAWTGACTGTGPCSVTMDAAKTVGATFTIQRFTLTVTPPVNGTIIGTGGILCGTAGNACGATYDVGTVLILGAAADSGYTFAGWSDACSGVGFCTITMDAAKTVGATFTIQRFTLTVTPPVNGTISGTGISCDSLATDCSETYDYGTVVALTATPVTGYELSAWAGACGAEPCSVTMDANKTVGASFTIQRFTLTVTPPTNGTITGLGISCDPLAADCTETYDYGTVVALTATPVTGHELSAWTGACTGTGPCAVTVDAAKTVGAIFTIQRFTLTVTPPVNGTITGLGISCDPLAADCTETYDYGTVVALTATPATGYELSAWTDACAGPGPCSVTMDAAKTVGATFTIQRFTLTVTPPVNGTITGLGISCDPLAADCTETYDYGTVVALTATPATGYELSAWTDACAGPGPCSVTMDAAKTVGATFTIQHFTLTVTPPVDGTITGTGIVCDSLVTDCSETYDYGTIVALTANAATGHELSAWTGACSGAGPCSVTVDANKTVGATFTIQHFTLTVTKPSAGTIISTDGILCGTAGNACSVTYATGTVLSLGAAADTGYTFAGWSDACSGVGICTITMDANKTVGATFTIRRFTLTVTPPVKGTITGTGIVCDPAGTDCTETYNYGTVVALTATPVTGYQLSAWTGVCTGTGPCSVTMDAAKAVGATFTIQRFTLSATPPVNGTITGTGIVCDPAGTDCTQTYDYGTAVAFTATPHPGYTLAAWTGACTGAGACSVTMDADKTLGATFALQTVMWTALVGVDATPTFNSLTKTASTAWGNGGAISVQQLASGDGYVEITASETTTYRMFGLSKGNTDASIQDIDFALYLRLGALLVYENGNYRGAFGTFIPGDTLRVAVEGGVVTYRKNGALLYTSLVAPRYPLLVDTALYSQNATITSAVWGTGTSPALSVSNATVTEGNSGTVTATFTVALSAVSPLPVTVNWATADGTATTADQDYVAASGTLTFEPGQTSLPIPVTVNGDTFYEPDETFMVNLFPSGGAILAAGPGLGTILNDDAPAPPPVVWTALVGVDATPTFNSLTKTASTAWGNGGAISVQQLASGDGHVEITASETTTYRMFGLSKGNTDASIQDIDFALYLRLGALLVYENGNYRGAFGTFIPGDTLRVAVEGGVVTYRKNGALLYTSLVAPRYPLLVDTALYSQNATITSAVWGTGTSPALSVSNATVTEGNSGTVTATFTVALSAVSPLPVTVDWATADGTATTADQDYVAASGTLTFEPGQTSLPIPVTVNGDTFYEPDETFMVNLSSPSGGAILAAGPGLGTILNDDANVPTPVVWTALVGVDATPTFNSLTKTASTAWGNGGAISVQQLASGDGYVEITASETTTYRMFGLSKGNTDASIQDIDFALYLRLGALLVYENGNYRGAFGTFISGDKLRVAVEGGVVTYRKNGALLYTSLVAPRYPLLVDTALYSQNATIMSAMFWVGP